MVTQQIDINNQMKSEVDIRNTQVVNLARETDELRHLFETRVRKPESDIDSLNCLFPGGSHIPVACSGN